MTKILALFPAHHSSPLHNPAFLSHLRDGSRFYDAGKNDDHTQKRRDASALYRLRQHLLCVIAPSPTRFTPYILSSSHLPHLHLPLYRPLPPSLPLSLFSLSFPPTIFSLFPPAFLPVFIPPCFHPSFRHSSWLEVQLSVCNSRAALLLSSLSPSDHGFPVAVRPFPRLGQPPPPNPQWRHVFPQRCWLSLCVR